MFFVNFSTKFFNKKNIYRSKSFSPNYVFDSLLCADTPHMHYHVYIFFVDGLYEFTGIYRLN